jgi:hypothetical protein
MQLITAKITITTGITTNAIIRKMKKRTDSIIASDDKPLVMMFSRRRDDAS